MALTTTTAMAIAAVCTIAAAGVSTYASIMQGKAQQDAANRQAKAEENQARLAEMNARMEAAQMEKDKHRTQSAQIASASGAGITLDGSFNDLFNETGMLYQKDIDQTIRTGNLQRAAGQYSASSYRAAGKNYAQAGWYNGAASLLGGIGGSMRYGDKAGWFD